MALTQRDYGSILGSLRNAGPNRSGELRLGSYVRNLVTPLDQSTVYNPGYVARSGDDSYLKTKWYPDTNNVDLTIKQGLLYTQVELERNTNYVLQIIDGINSENNEITIAVDDQAVESWTFNNYLFFRTGNYKKETGTANLKIAGLSFGYKILGEGENGELIQLRNFISRVPAKVFLFKSDLSWIVNKSGEIVGSIDSPLRITINNNAEAIGGWYTQSDLIQVLSKHAPKITVDEENNQLIITPDLDADDKDIFDANWANYLGLKDEEKKKNPFHSIKLVAFRNYLEPSIRKSNNGTQTKQYTWYRTYQNSWDDSNNIQGYFHILPKSLDNDVFQVTLKLDNMVDIPTKLIKGGEKYGNQNAYRFIVEFDLPILSLAGKNFEYEENINNHIKTELKKKYTSFSFAWGLGLPKTLQWQSPYSIPVIIQRGLYAPYTQQDSVGGISVGDTLYIYNSNDESSKNIKITWKTGHEYYSKEAIFIEEN